MGTYYYYLRSKTMKAKDETEGGSGDSIELAFFTYGYKCACIDPYDSKYKLFCANVERNRKNAWDKHSVGDKVPFVVQGDKPKEGLFVYRNVTNSGWLDSGKFPGEAYGYLMKVGGRWVISSYYDDKSGGGTVGFGEPVPYVGSRYGIENDYHATLGYFCKMPDGKVAYISLKDKALVAEAAAAWKPYNDAKRAKEERERAKRAEEAAKRKAEAKAKKEALMAKKAAMAKEMAALDVEISKLSWVA